MIRSYDDLLLSYVYHSLQRMMYLGLRKQHKLVNDVSIFYLGVCFKMVLLGDDSDT